MSKTWGLPGIRIGWLITRDADLMERFISAKEQIGITGSLLDETAAYQTLVQRDTLLPGIRSDIAEGFNVVRDWVEKESAVEWVEPDGGVTCCLRLSGASDDEMHRFYDLVKNTYRTAIGPGYWFKMPLDHMRIGFAHERPEDTAGGLECLSRAIREI